MKRHLYIIIVGILLSFVSCTMTDVDVDVKVTPSSKGGLQFIGAAEDFDEHTVGTRAEDEVSDSHISEMTMLIFKQNGDMLPAVDADGNPLASSHINIDKPNPTFLIEANKYNGTGILASMEAGITTKYYNNKAEDLGACKIYIVANAYHLIGERLENGEINTEEKLFAALLDTNETLAMPKDAEGNYIGLPMIGCAWEEGQYNDDGTRKDATFNLAYQGGNLGNSVATIPLKKLYSKVCFTMAVNSFQYVKGEQIPEFKLTDVEVFNIPAKVRMEYQEGDYISKVNEGYLYTGAEGDPAFSLKGKSLWPSRTITYHDSSDKLEFYFFMPEHMLKPNFNRGTYEGYPDNLPDDRRQYFKPKMVGAGADGTGAQLGQQIAPFVRIHGDYTNHNGQIYTVSYDIYLGQNEIDDFEVKRNQQLTNIITINGLTNHKDAYPGLDNNISIDHRVTMQGTGYILSMEREAILDSHFEVRPLDVTLEKNSKMTIVIPEAYRGIVAMEDDDEAYSGTNSPYVSDSERRGVRKYFTTNLVQELNSENGGTITIVNNTDAKVIRRVWFYIDENPNVYDNTLPIRNEGGELIDYSGKNITDKSGVTYNISANLYRNAKVEFYFGKGGAEPDTQGTPTTVVNFQQWNLWRVWSADGARYYDIEHEEEYLNNYASDQPYGGTQDGMPWGLDGVQLSKEHDSFYIDEVNTEWTDYVKSNPLLKYDFYIGKYDSFVSDGVTVHGFAGRHFTEEIYDATKNNSDNDKKVEVLTMVQQPSGAVEYCYNKNKRDANGNVEKVEWYLPSADELEDFIVPAYAYFKEFQNNYYWTSQPAYIRNAFYYEYATGSSKGRSVRDSYAFVSYEDNKNYARATKVVAKGNDVFDYALSGLNKIPNDADNMDSCINANGEHLMGNSYFDVMYAWYRWNGGTDPNTIWKADTHFNEKKNSSETGVRYHVELGHSFDKMYQVDEKGDHGYHHRTKNNRVRCVRRNWNPDNNYEAEIVYTVSTTPATTLDKSGNTKYVIRNATYPNTSLTTSGNNVAASSSAVGVDNYVVIEGNKIKSVAKKQYFNGDDSNVSFNDSGTSYTISNTNGNLFTISVRTGFIITTTYYLKQTSDTAVSMSTGNNGNNTWCFHEVKKEYKVKVVE